MRQRLLAVARGDEEPDLVVAGALVFSAYTREWLEGDVAVADGRNAGIGSFEGGERIEVAGRPLVPGFVDAHVHPVWAGLHLMRCDLAELGTAPAYLEAIGSYARANRGLPWVLGSGWSMPWVSDIPTAEPMTA